MPAREAYRQLQSVRHRLPQPVRQGEALPVADLLSIAADFEVFCFDAFGVLNVGQRPIPGVAAVIAELRRRGKRVFVLSNAAAFEKKRLRQRFLDFGYDFEEEDIISSRDALLQHAALNPQALYGVIGAAEHQGDIQHLRLAMQDSPDFAAAEAFLFLSSLRWNADKQAAWLEMLRERPRPVHVGNPDLLAPQGQHSSIEAGFYTLLLPEALFASVQLYGKPFPEIFQVLLQRLRRDVPREKILMIGDTLHTDVLGALAFGLRAALVSNHGFFQDLDVAAHIRGSDIHPDFVLKAVARP